MTYIKMISEVFNSLSSVFIESFFDPGPYPFCSFWSSVAVTLYKVLLHCSSLTNDVNISNTVSRYIEMFF